MIIKIGYGIVYVIGLAALAILLGVLVSIDIVMGSPQTSWDRFASRQL